MNSTLSLIQLLGQKFGITVCGYSIDGTVKTVESAEFESTDDPYKLLALTVANSLTGSDEDAIFRGSIVITSFDDDCVLRHRHFKF